MDIYNKILKLKEEKNALILAHYYQNEEIQKVADYVGDSYYLSRISKESTDNIVIFCGVDFMAESAKILSPNKKVLLANNTATCPMANMIKIEEVLKIKDELQNSAVVTYINSSLELKTISDVIVTSSNAEKIINKLPQKNIIFIPDKNLGSYLSEKIPNKNFILLNGYCYVHNNISKENVLKVKSKFNNVKIACHPECNKDIRALSELVGSTSELIEFTNSQSEKELLILTENGVEYSFNDKNFYHKLEEEIICNNMKKTTLEDVFNCLSGEENEVKIDSKLITKASKPLQMMHDLAQ